ncbi:hypothetical protein CC1G_04660 [Coprinopsis cinerea okayama7|uniref:BTB domain-containing protein n=1 Tax=Coprinopsis cinerea (strain Okayama-7 / 130 / ATCC MYA-4618 / FGSC 9003) TaxID=240176 RepID=A8N553_COPC7|nr:hypothetical protein CC1G_04660 [Coprinopsis cinerea okayama7\|eukprot:XP_001829971.1 hypothetical protein CC1G_04660 [Coprinopsis cinerea okayama7\
MTSGQKTRTDHKYGVKDKDWYWELVELEVEGHIFNVPKYHLIHGSERFAAAYGIRNKGKPSTPDPAPDGEPPVPVVDLIGHDAPIPLVHVQLEEFRIFLSFLYPIKISFTIEYTKDEWIVILKFASFWHFEDIKRMAMEELESIRLSPPEKICLAKRFYIAEWLLDGYEELIDNPQTMSMDVSEEIGHESAVRVFMCRENRQQYLREGREYLKQVFAKELEIIRQRSQLCPIYGDNLLHLQFKQDRAWVKKQECSEVKQEPGEN